MTQKQDFDTILELKLAGSLAHYRKFYTNASSLTYSIPPRTSLCGLVASILKMPRDSYYDALSSRNLGVAIAIAPNPGFRRQFFTTNYVGNDKLVNDVSGHKQCRLELLMPAPGYELSWNIYLGFKEDSGTITHELKERIEKQNLGYDLYLGQRQFRANISLIDSYDVQRFKSVPESEYVDSVIAKNQIVDLDLASYKINIERMPMEQALETKGKKSYRRSVRFADLLIEATGNRLHGRFTDLVQIENQAKSRISFL
jgi:CRISPR-associated protein Cas5h